MQASAKTSLMADGGWEPLNYVYPRTSGGGTMPTLDRAYGRICKGEPMPSATLRTLQDLEPSAAGGVECVQGGRDVWAEGGGEGEGMGGGAHRYHNSLSFTSQTNSN